MVGVGVLPVPCVMDEYDTNQLFPTSLYSIKCMSVIKYMYILHLLFFLVYRMQLKAPVPVPVINQEVPNDTPAYLGRDYHGDISHIEANNLLSSQPNGSYLVRNSRSANGEFHTLSLK